MFWKGAFPGISFEVDPVAREQNIAVEIDSEALKEQVERYMNGLQRYIASQGLTTKSLEAQVASPLDHITAQLQAIAIALSCPMRILLGSERGELASSQDQKAWNTRVAKRQNRYLTPRILRPCVDRLMAAGVLPLTDDLKYTWPDLNTPSDKEKADTALILAQAVAAYIAAGGQVLLPPITFLVEVLGFDQAKAEEILEAAAKIEEEELAQMEEEAELGHERQKELIQEQGKQKQQGQPFPPR